MKRNPLWLLAIPAIIWPVFIFYAKPIFALQETKTIGALLVYSLVVGALLLSTVLPFLFWISWKQRQQIAKLEEKIDKETNPKYAGQYYSYEKTPDKGVKTIVVSEDIWVVIEWDKKENKLTITRPPRHEDRIPVQVLWYNAKVEEVQKVKVEDLPRIS